MVTAEVNGVEVPCLLDSMSQVSTVTESFFEKHLKQPLEDISSWFKITAANGTEIPCVGLFETSVKVSGVLYNNVSFLVVKDPECPFSKKRKEDVSGVIGANLLQTILGDTDINLNVDEAKSKFQDDGLLEGLKTFQIRRTTCEKMDVQLKDPSRSKIGWVKVNCNKVRPIHISADSGEIVSGSVSKVLDGSEVLVESSDSLSLPPGVVIFPTVCKVENGRVRIQIRNYTKHPHSGHNYIL